MTLTAKEVIAKLQQHNDHFKTFIMPPPYRMEIEEIKALLDYVNKLKK